MDNKGQLLNELQSESGLPDRETVQRVAQSVLSQLHDRLGPEADHLEAQLPQDLKPYFSGGILQRAKSAVTGQDKFNYEQMVAKVADDGGVDRQKAEQLTSAVFQKVKEHISDGESRHVAAALPKDIQQAWDSA